MTEMTEIEKVGTTIQEELMAQSEKGIFVRIAADKGQSRTRLLCHVDLASPELRGAFSEEDLFSIRDGVDFRFFAFLSGIIHTYDFHAVGYADIYAQRAGQRSDGNAYFYAVRASYCRDRARNNLFINRDGVLCDF